LQVSQKYFIREIYKLSFYNMGFFDNPQIWNRLDVAVIFNSDLDVFFFFFFQCGNNFFGFNVMDSDDISRLQVVFFFDTPVIFLYNKWVHFFRAVLVKVDVVVCDLWNVFYVRKNSLGSFYCVVLSQFFDICSQI